MIVLYNTISKIFLPRLMEGESELVSSVDLSDEKRKGKNQVDLQVTLHHQTHAV